jgi:hypothetical protein
VSIEARTGGRIERIAREIRRFVDHPATNLVKGLCLMGIGIVDASATFREDTAHQHLRVGHGLILIGVFSVLGALPYFLDSLETAETILEAKVNAPSPDATSKDSEPS